MTMRAVWLVATAAALEYSLSASHLRMKPSRSSELVVQPHLILLKIKKRKGYVIGLREYK